MKDNEDFLDEFGNKVEEQDSLDEETLAAKYDAGEFDKPEAVHESIEENYEDVSVDREKKVFFSALFLSGKPVEMSTFHKMINPINLENKLLMFTEEFNDLKLGLRIRKVSGGFQMVTDSDVTTYLERFFGERTESLSKAALETVAIIAYRQPITKVEIEEMRGVNSSGTMKFLLDKNLIKVVGRKAVPGKPLLYATTKFFLEYFGLNDLSELPTFREWQGLKS